MGAKTNIDQAPTLTPEQKGFMDMILRGSNNFLNGFQLGEGWGGPSDDSYTPGSGPGGKTWDASLPPGGGGSSGDARGPGRERTGDGPGPQRGGAAAPPGMTGQAIAGMAPVPSAPGTAMTPPGFVNPFGSYSDRDKLVDPIVNPFRRNMRG